MISLKPRQYGEAGVVRYDLMAVTADDDYAAARDELLDADEVDELLGLRIDSVTAEFDGVRRERADHGGAGRHGPLVLP